MRDFKYNNFALSRGLLGICILASTFGSSALTTVQPSLTQHDGRGQQTSEQSQALTQSGLSQDFKYVATINAIDHTGTVFNKNGQQYIFPDNKFYAADSVNKLDISAQLEGIGEKPIDLGRHTVVYGRLNKYLRGVRIKFGSCNCAYPLVFFYANGDLSFEFVREQSAYMARIVTGGPAEPLASVLRSEIHFELGKWKFVENPHKDNRFLYFSCAFYNELQPHFELVVDIDTQKFQFPQVSPEEPEHTQEEQAQEVVEYFDQEEQKDDKIVVEDIKKDSQGEDIQPVQENKSQQDEQKHIIVNEVTAPMSTSSWVQLAGNARLTQSPNRPT